MSEIAATEPVTQLDFQEAMRDFKFMFPEMDSDVIEVRASLTRINKIGVSISPLFRLSCELTMELWMPPLINY